MIKMADLTNKHGTTEDRRQNYRAYNPQSVKFSNLRFYVKVSPVWVLLGQCAKTIFLTLIIGEDAFSVLGILDSVRIIVGG